MKKVYSILTVLICLIGAGVYAGDDVNHAPYKGSAEFERLKTLAGNWEGTAVMQGEPRDVRVDYRVTSAGSAVVETLFPGTPHEMVSVYNDTDGRPGMTHYCAMKNQPELEMDRSTEQSIHFNFTETAGIDADRDAHMHALTVRFIDSDTIEHEWVLYQDGKQVDTTKLKLQRL